MTSQNPYSGFKRPYAYGADCAAPAATSSSRSGSSSKTSSSSLPISTNRGECYTVLGGQQPGIYFTLEEAKNYHKVGQSIKSFSKVVDAKVFMRQNGFRPVDNGGWISNDKRPILYFGRQQEQSTSGLFGPSSAATSCSSNNNQAALSVSPKSHAHVRIDLSSSPEDTPTSRSSTSSTTSSPSLIAPIFKKARPGAAVGGASGAGTTSTGVPPSPDPAINSSTQTEFQFDAIQKEAIDAAFQGKSVFITGVAGTGKSLVTRAIVNNAREMKMEIAACAPTGVAAVNLGPELGAQTIHSLAGCGCPQRGRDFKKLLGRFTAKRWRQIEMLIIDEIGMLNADFLDWLDVYVRKARKAPLEPFGGIQLICVGDFAQLGPIPGENTLSNKPFDPSDPAADCFLNLKECAAYAFQTSFWREANFHHVHLKKVYRQSDLAFVQCLMDIRQAKAETPYVRNLVTQCSTPLEEREDLVIPQGIKPTILYCTNRNVDRENSENLAKLNTQYKAFQAVDTVELSSDVANGGAEYVQKILEQNSFFDQCSASKVVHLKVQAQVMLLQNLDIENGLVNGSRGVVVKFALCPVVQSQGKTMEERLIGPSDVDRFPGCTFEQIKYNHRAEFDGKVWRVCRFEKYPLVLFANGESRIILPEKFERSLFRQGKCIRTQIPLRLAWALTIHKSQGATLDLVVCDLTGCFCSGQAYVALSRARSMLGLQIKNFNALNVTTDPLVDSFYKALDGGEQSMKTFLNEEAGIWWYPILGSPEWLRMFTGASNREALESSEVFREWLQTYKPVQGYSGWGSKSYGKKTSKASTY